MLQQMDRYVKWGALSSINCLVYLDKYLGDEHAYPFNFIVDECPQEYHDGFAIPSVNHLRLWMDEICVEIEIIIIPWNLLVGTRY